MTKRGNLEIMLGILTVINANRERISLNKKPRRVNSIVQKVGINHVIFKKKLRILKERLVVNEVEIKGIKTHFLTELGTTLLTQLITCQKYLVENNETEME